MARKTMVAGALSAGLVVAGLAVAGTGGSAGAATRPAVATPAVTALAGSVAPFTADTRATGDVPAAQRLTIQLWLQPRTTAATSFAQAVTTPGSARFHQYLSPDGYAARFAATPAAASAVESWLRAQGFTAVAASPDRSYVQATAAAATINQAFAVRLKLYPASAAVNAGGSALWSNDRPVTLPATLASLVLGVTGLDNAAAADPDAAAQPQAEASAAAAPCSAYYGQHLRGGLPAYLGRTSYPTQVCGYSAKQLRAVYGANLASTGQGETIAFVELAPADPDDFAILTDYAKVMGLPAPSQERFTERSAGKGCSAAGAGGASAGPAAEYEEQMDIEAAYAMAPGANEVVVAGGACGGSDPETQGLLSAEQAVLTGSGNHPLASISSNSWESGTEGQPASETKIEHAQLLQAAAEGVGMYFASGDSPGVDAPASDPYATAVGGTTLGIGRTGNRVFETGWSTGLLTDAAGKWAGQGEAGAAGGGPSTVYKQPGYQQGIVPAALSRVAGKTGTYRSVPDISASADPDTPMAVVEDSAAPGRKPVFYLLPGAGTSEATPLVAGMVAAAQQGSKKAFGFLNPVLYQLAGTSALHDVLPLSAGTPAVLRAEWCSAACGAAGLMPFDVQSTDKAKGYDGQVTLKGYDNMSGLGTPNGQSFIAALRKLE